MSGLEYFGILPTIAVVILTSMALSAIVSRVLSMLHRGAGEDKKKK